MEKFSFKTVGDTNALFEDPSTWKSEILIAGLVKELKANICYPLAGFGNFSSSKGDAFLKVDWQIYSKLDRSVVHSVSTEGSSSVKDAVAGGDTVTVLNAFSQATRNLLADTRFRELVSKGGQTIKDTTFKSGESIVIATNMSKKVSTDPTDWTNAVVTVFAGRGHGSGFVISDNLIMTNHHVVGDSNSVAIKFSNGIQIVGKVVASNTGRDVALVKIDGSMPKHFRLERATPSIGADVYAIGSPLDEKYHSTVSRGIVSGIREEYEKRFIQSDVNVRPGNSGGPLLNKQGDVIGITVSGLVLKNDAQGINFFIPIDDALKSMGAVGDAVVPPLALASQMPEKTDSTVKSNLARAEAVPDIQPTTSIQTSKTDETLIPNTAINETAKQPIPTKNIPHNTLKQGSMAYSAEQLAKDSGCSTSSGVRPYASPLQVTGSLEIYSIECTKQQMIVKCESRICKQMK